MKELRALPASRGAGAGVPRLTRPALVGAWLLLLAPWAAGAGGDEDVWGALDREIALLGRTLRVGADVEIDIGGYIKTSYRYSDDLVFTADPDTFADSYTVLFEGALVLRQVHDRDDAARVVRPLIEQLLEAHLPGSPDLPRG